MMFDDSSLVGGANSSMLNTSMKSEGGLSVLNTSRGEEVLISVTMSGRDMIMVAQEAVEGADNVKEEAGEPGLAFDADSIKVFVDCSSQYMHITPAQGYGGNNWDGASTRGGSQRACRGSNLQVSYSHYSAFSPNI